MAFLSGSEATTINSTITELYPAIAFNNGKKFTDVNEFQKFIIDIADKDRLFSGKTANSFVDKDDSVKAKKLIYDTNNIRPAMRDEKISNAIGILNYFYEQHSIRQIEKIVWGYRAKPKGVPAGHAGDDFIFYKSNQRPKILGISLKAGTAKSNEPKLNSYVRTTIKKDYWKRANPNAESDLKKRLWTNVYSKLLGLDKKKVNAQNYIDLSGTGQKVNEEVSFEIIGKVTKNSKVSKSKLAETQKDKKASPSKAINPEIKTKSVKSTKKTADVKKNVEKKVTPKKI